jgi:hypothetical protein
VLRLGRYETSGEGAVSHEEEELCRSLGRAVVNNQNLYIAIRRRSETMVILKSAALVGWTTNAFVNVQLKDYYLLKGTLGFCQNMVLMMNLC